MTATTTETTNGNHKKTTITIWFCQRRHLFCKDTTEIHKFQARCFAALLFLMALKCRNSTNPKNPRFKYPM